MECKRTQLILDAQRKGFGVVENEDATGWLVTCPAKLRMPAHTQGEFKSSDRAWMAAAGLAREWPEPLCTPVNL
jgi:hypothetical protein